MNKLVIAILLLTGATARATVRCPGAAMQSLAVDSGQPFSLAVTAVPGVLDYEVSRTASWTINPRETWSPLSTITTDRVRQTSGTPSITERLYNTGAEFPAAIYYVVTATNAFDPSFQPCAQDFLVSVNPDPNLSRDAVRSVIPVAGSLAGANGSRYKTRLTLQNPWSDSITGHLVFHRSGQSASADDVNISYALDRNAVQTWDDIVAAMGTSGLGSIDILPDRVSSGVYPMPDVRARILSVAPSGGSFGTDVPSISLTSSYQGAVLTGPSTPSILIDDVNGAKRLAIGIRTLSEAVDLAAVLTAPDGSVRKTVTRAFPADYHEQRPLSEWFGSLAQSNDRIVLLVSHHSTPRLDGGAIVYLAETDNVTNDVSLVLAERRNFALLQPVVQCGLGCNFLLR